MKKEKTDSGISAKMDMTELLQQMESIAAALITGPYITDFTVHDTGFIRRTNAGRSFVWLVYGSEASAWKPTTVKSGKAPGFQDFSQLNRDYGDKESKVIQNTVGNIFSGQAVGETAKTLSERFGKILQKRQPKHKLSMPMLGRQR